MFAKRDGSRILFCSSRHDVRFEIDVGEFADVSSACSSLDDATVVLTAARDKSDYELRREVRLFLPETGEASSVGRSAARPKRLRLENLK